MELQRSAMIANMSVGSLDPTDTGSATDGTGPFGSSVIELESRSGSKSRPTIRMIHAPKERDIGHNRDRRSLGNIAAGVYTRAIPKKQFRGKLRLPNIKSQTVGFCRMRPGNSVKIHL